MCNAIRNHKSVPRNSYTGKMYNIMVEIKWRNRIKQDQIALKTIAQDSFSLKDVSIQVIFAKFEFYGYSYQINKYFVFFTVNKYF